jgi:hypothetical protein
MKKTLIFLIALVISLTVRAGGTTIKDMCPALLEETSSKEPKFRDFVTVKPKTGNDSWSAQYKKYKQALEKFESQYSVELKLVELEWEKLIEKQSPSQNRFYELSANDESEELLSEVKAVCWSEIMGIDEMEKDNLCNPLEKPPASKEWNRILLCTIKRVKLLDIELL